MGEGQQLIVAALRDEVRGLKAKMAIDMTIHFKQAILFHGALLNKEIDLLVTGIGAANAQKGLEEVFRLRRPDPVLFVGFAGGCSPVAGVGSLVLAQKVISVKNGYPLFCSETLLKKGAEICEEKKMHFQVGGLVTVDGVVHHAHEKADIGARFGALALDMEAYEVAKIAKDQGSSWFVVKAILDPVEMNLPDLQNCVDAGGQTKPFSAMKHLLKNPNDLTKMTSIKYNAHQARESLTKFVEAFIAF